MDSSTALRALIVSLFAFSSVLAQTINTCNGVQEDLLNRCICCTANGIRLASNRIGAAFHAQNQGRCRSVCNTRGAEFYQFVFAAVASDDNCFCGDGFNSLSDAPLTVVGYSSGGIDGSAFGDPHIAKWNGDKYDFHGECDLVLLQAPEFADGLGLTVHIRTTIENWFSYIEEVGIASGGHVANVNTEGFWVNSEKLTSFPAQSGPFRVKRKILTDKDGNDLPMYEVSINDEPALRIRAPKSKYMFVKPVTNRAFSNAMKNFADASGLMGEYVSGRTIGRDRFSEFKDMNEFGMEWQVRPDEEMLFSDIREPQLPHAVCNMPTKVSDVVRILQEDPGLRMRAEQACSHADSDMIELCVQDVIATGDVGIAAGY